MAKEFFVRTKQHKTPMQACIIPEKGEKRPSWLDTCKIVYENDSTVRIQTLRGITLGRVGIDCLLFHGISKSGYSKVNLILKGAKPWTNYTICNKDGQDIGKLSELYPA